MENFTWKRAVTWALFGFIVGVVMPLRATEDRGELAFSLHCPPDVTISCGDDLYNLDKYGKAYIHDYHGERPAGKPKVVKDINSCGKGVITRTWTVEDYNWNWHSCTQTIYVTGGGLTEDDIIWPQNYDIEACKPNTDPKKLPEPYGYPRYQHYDCAQPMASYKDEVFHFSKSCTKIIRKWTVLDWCEYNPNKRPLPGHFTHYQIIKVSAADKPTLVCPPDSIYKATKSCDSTLVQIDSVKAFTSCDSNLTITNNSPYAFENGPDASGIYPVGTTKVTFKIEYGCGKDTTCVVEINVQPDLGPVPYCRDGIITTLMGIDIDKDGDFDEGMVEIWAKDLDIGSWHPCGLPFTFSFSPDSVVMNRSFSCEDLGENEVRMYVTDASGNQSYCRTKVIIQNNNVRIPDCEPDTTGGGGGGGTAGPILSWSEISGAVNTDKPRAVPNAEITLIAFDQDTILTSRNDTLINARLDTITLPSGGTQVIVVVDTVVTISYDTSYGDKIHTALTDQSGNYHLGAWLDGKDYNVSAKKEIGDVLEGVDIMDALLHIQYLIGTANLDNAYRHLAADIDNDGEITYSDFELLYDLVLGARSELPNKRNWLLIPEKHQFSDPTNPWAAPIPSSVDITAMQNDELVNFVAVKIGDLDGNIQPKLKKPTVQSRAEDVKNLLVRDQNIRAGERFEFSISLDEFYTGVLNFKATNILGNSVKVLFHQKTSPLDRVLTQSDNFTVGFHDKDEIVISAISMADGKLSDVLKLNMDSYLYNSRSDKASARLRFSSSENRLSLEVYPNPIHDQSTLKITSDMDGEATVLISDVSGRRIFTQDLQLVSSTAELTISAELFPVAGIYIYQVVMNNTISSGKLQVIK